MGSTACIMGLVCLLLGCSEDRIVYSGDPGDPIARWRRASPLAGLPEDQVLQIPTYDGSGQAVHPDILCLRDAYRGHRFYLAMTPYADNADSLENPSILVSDNGIDFREPVAGLNPLVGPPGYDHNDDPDLIFARRRFHLYYLETSRPDSQNVVRLESLDAVRWTGSTAVHYDLAAGDPFIVSPAVVRCDRGYRLYYVNTSRPGHPIEYLFSRDGVAWDKRAAAEISADLPRALVPWHLDVFPGNGRYYMLCSGPYRDLNLYLAYSTDLDHWQFLPAPILRHSPEFHHSQSIYRSTGLADGDLLAVWFSFRDLDGRWSIGFKRFTFSGLGLEPVWWAGRAPPAPAWTAGPRWRSRAHARGRAVLEAADTRLDRDRREPQY